MGRTKRTTPTDSRRERFSQHFPRLFAYVYGVTGNEETAREVTIASFTSVLNADALDEHDFTQALYTAARKLIRKQRDARKDGLTANEREIMSLLFDAQLSRAEVAELLGIKDESLLATLVGGLKKLRDATPSERARQNFQTLSA